MSETRVIPRRNVGIFAALRFHDFRLLWVGLLISNLGTWMQFTAIGYVIAQAAGSPMQAAVELGYVGAARAAAVLLLSPIAGVAADRLPRRLVLICANVAMSLAALLFALLASLHALVLPALVAISALNSGAQSFDSPARQSWLPLLVDRAFVGNAIGLNSVAFNAPAVIGPALAGLLIAWTGVATSFYINAIATLAVVVVVVLMKPAPPSATTREPMLTSMRAGIVFLLEHRVLRWILIAFFVTALLARPYSSLAPAFVVNVLHAGPLGLGYAYAAIGIGGLLGAFVVAYAAQRERRSLLWLFAGVAMTIGIAALGMASNLHFALVCYAIAGTGTLAYLGATNTLIQTLAPDELRGRAVSVYTMIALGVVPLGTLVVGTLAARIGLHATFASLGILSGALIIGIYTFVRPVRAA